MIRFAAAAAAAALMGSAVPVTAFAIANGQTDSFENGTLQGWRAGLNNPNGPANVAFGGPAGSDDNVMEVRANGDTDPLGAPGGKLLVFNSVQWAGNYLAAGISGIEMDVRNTGNSDVVLRLILDSGAAAQSAVTGPVLLARNTDWTRVTFSLASGNLVGGSPAAVLSGVSLLNLVHSPDAITSRQLAPAIDARIQVDNITAVPEPGAATLSGAGLLLLAAHFVRLRRIASRL